MQIVSNRILCLLRTFVSFAPPALPSADLWHTIANRTMSSALLLHTLLAAVAASSCLGFVPSRRLSLDSNGLSTTFTCTNALMFDDDDCEDLCSAFADVILPPAPIAAASTTGVQETKNAVAIDDATGCRVEDDDCQVMAKITVHNSPLLKGAAVAKRRSRELWWPDVEPDECKTCIGKGKCTCQFCEGTSMMSAMGGDTALFLEGLGQICPVCNDGMVSCRTCTGTGLVFSWNKTMNRTDSLRP